MSAIDYLRTIKNLKPMETITGALHFYIPGDSYDIHDTTQEWIFCVDNTLSIDDREIGGEHVEYKYTLGEEDGIKTLYVMSNNWELGEPLDGMMISKLKYEYEVEHFFFIKINEEVKWKIEPIIGKLYFLAHTKK